MGRGGYRPGAGRKKGQLNIASQSEREMFQAQVARRTRAIWRAARKQERKGGEPAGPPPSNVDAEASVALIVSLLLRAAYKGDSRAAIHLDERLHGRVKYSIEQSGPDGGPIAILPLSPGVYACETADGQRITPGGAGVAADLETPADAPVPAAGVLGP